MFIFGIDIAIYYSIRFLEIFQEISTKYEPSYGFILLTLAYIIPTSIREVLEKYIMQTYYLTSSIILLIEGIFVLIVFLLYFGIVQLIPCSNLNPLFKNICDLSQWVIVKEDFLMNFTYSNISTLFAWAYIISVYLASLFRVETINKLTPTHRFVGEMLFQFYWFIYNISIVHIINLVWLESTQVILLLFATFVFNEFIIIYLCNLDYNTRMEIAKRANHDKLIAIEISSVYDEDKISDLIENVSLSSNQ